MRAQNGGRFAAYQNISSLFRRIATASREALCRRLLVWSVALTFASAAGGMLLLDRPSLFYMIEGVPLLLFACCVSMTASVYFLIRFTLTREWSHALSAAAFWSLTCGIAMQALVDAKAQSAPGGVIDSAGWLIGAILLACAGRSHRKATSVGKLAGACQVGMSALLGISLPLAIGSCIFGSHLGVQAAGLPASAFLGAGLSVTIEAVTVCALLAALVSHHQRCREHVDRTAIAVCYFLVPCALSLVFQMMSAGNAALEAMGQLLVFVPWPVLVLGFGIEMAVEQADVADHLKELDTLHQVSWSVVGARNLEELLHRFAQTLRDKTDAKVVTIYLEGNWADTLQVAAACDPDGPMDNVGQHYPTVSTDRRPGFHTGHSVKAFTTGQPQTAKDVFVDVELVGWRTIGREDGCALSLPLADSDGTIGVLAIYFADHKQLTPPRAKLLHTLAKAAAPAIRSSRPSLRPDQVQSDTTDMDIAA